MPKLLPILLNMAANTLSKIPIEKFMFKTPSKREEMLKLREILEGQQNLTDEPQTRITTIPLEEAEKPPETAKVHLAANQDVTSTVTTKETIDYQNREIGKVLVVMAKHCVQKFRINEKICDCGQSKHLLELEALADETIPMVDNPDIYYRILDWVKRLGPKSSIAAVQSGQYDNEYAVFASEARDLRKELLGTLDTDALWPSVPDLDLSKPAPQESLVRLSKSGNPLTN